ncbi:cytochrome P450 2U1-like isoform X2 [Limulus polyphemus]|nr:cytochrome P450 2U1-like isoform X2 [Limulus polyphemus]
MIFAGTDTVSNTLYWGMKLMILHPEIQDRIYREIEEVVGKERLPSNAHRNNMPYTEATLMELQRFANIVPLSIFHSNPVETTFHGYTIPKRSIILANLWTVHRDPLEWPDPDKFVPSRFLDHDGKVVQKKGYIPFGIGKRACLGIPLAKIELFLFFTTILQSYRITATPQENEFCLNIQNTASVVKPYKVIAIPRM